MRAVLLNENAGLSKQKDKIYNIQSKEDYRNKGSGKYSWHSSMQRVVSCCKVNSWCFPPFKQTIVLPKTSTHVIGVMFVDVCCGVSLAPLGNQHAHLQLIQIMEHQEGRGGNSQSPAIKQLKQTGITWSYIAAS